jgi:FkbM family methyltransferase
MSVLQAARSTVRRAIRKCLRLLMLPKHLLAANYRRSLQRRLGETEINLSESRADPVQPQFTFETPVSEKNYEDIIERVYRAILRPGCRVIDIGASVGRHTLGLADCVYPDGLVIAFEPLPSCRANLEKLFREQESHRLLRRQVVLSPIALAAQPATAEFVHAVDVPGWSGLKERIYDGPTRTERIKVKVETIDRMLADLKRCDFIKIDAEGGEYDALRGGEQLLTRCRPVVAFEFGANSCTAYGLTTNDMAQFWARLRYRIVDANGNLLSESEFAQSAIDQRVWDYFAIPGERRNLITIIQSCCQEAQTVSFARTR